MDSDEAKAVLLRYRGKAFPEDADEETLTALEYAAEDPVLASWLENHIHFQRAVGRGLSEVQVPEGLRGQILSEKPTTDGASTRRKRWRFLAGAAVAAGIVLLSAWAPWQSDVENTFATFRSRMVKASLRGYSMDVETELVSELREHFNSVSFTTSWTMPSGLRDHRLLGGAVIAWRNQPAAMICYGEGSEPTLWLFVVESAVVPNSPTGHTASYERVNQAGTLSWETNGTTYLLVGQHEEEKLRRLIEPGA